MVDFQTGNSRAQGRLHTHDDSYSTRQVPPLANETHLSGMLIANEHNIFDDNTCASNSDLRNPPALLNSISTNNRSRTAKVH